MSRRRFFGVFFGIVGATLLAIVLYIALADLGRHKGRIEALVTKTLGRPFAIDGPFSLRLIPVVDVSAEGIRLGNAPGGSQPQMVEIGKVAVQIGFWSLISGPPDVRAFELRDATLLLERDSDGRGNWHMGGSKQMTMPNWMTARSMFPWSSVARGCTTYASCIAKPGRPIVWSNWISCSFRPARKNCWRWRVMESSTCIRWR